MKRKLKGDTQSFGWHNKPKRSRVKKAIKTVITKENLIMDSIKALTDAVTALQAQVVLVLEALAGGVPSPKIQEAVDSINAETAKLKAAITTT